MHILKFIPPPMNHRSMEHHYIMLVSHIAECTYTKIRCTSCQSTIHLCNTTTSCRFHIKKNAHILRSDAPPPSDHTFV